MNMTTDIQPKARVTNRQTETAIARRSFDSFPEDAPRPGRWWRRGLAFLVIVVIIAIAVPLIVTSFKPEESGPKLTHTITRGNLRVTVTEQGTLESSNNTEIKCKVRGAATVLWVIEAGTVVKPGDEVVRLDPSTIEDNISAQKIVYETALANKIISESDVAVAKTNITEYLESTYEEERNTIENEIFVAEQALKTAQLSYASTKRMVARGLVTMLQLEGEVFAVESAQKTLELTQKRLNALEKYTKEKNLQELRSTLRAAEATLAARTASLDLETARLNREEQQLENCVILAQSSGMVIHPSAAAWKETPDIEEGATVRQDQVLLIIPDLSKMQVKVGIHESKVDRVKPGMPAKIALQDLTIDGNVDTVASITKPAGWWTGNVVKYDTIIQIASPEGLKPGMSAGVEIVLAEYMGVPTIPVAAVVETEKEYYCWVKTPTGQQRRSLQLGDSNDQFIVVKAGVKEGDEVVLNPLAFIDEAQKAALKPLDAVKSLTDTDEAAESGDETSSEKPAEDTPSGESKPATAEDTDDSK
jgi:multidrug efflux pump subunit AcrA (membrane-fusion protein)